MPIHTLPFRLDKALLGFNEAEARAPRMQINRPLLVLVRGRLQ